MNRFELATASRHDAGDRLNFHRSATFSQTEQGLGKPRARLWISSMKQDDRATRCIALKLELNHRFTRPNGWRLSGARRSPPDDERSPRTDFSRSAARVRCSRGLGRSRIFAVPIL
jgi:hypothetical protein